MDREIELISDGDAIAANGNSTAVERFMAPVSLSNVGSTSLGAAFRTAASAAQTGTEIAAISGRWVKLTQESAQNLQQYGLTATKTPVSHAMVGQRGSIPKWL